MLKVIEGYYFIRKEAVKKKEQAENKKEFM